MTLPFVYEIIRSPIVTEKSTQLMEHNKYVFKVAIDATKPQIKHALKKLFNVDVKSVNIIVVPGKVKRFRGQEGQRSDYKKAIVTLAKGQSVDYTSGV